jgi:hypothetical protein
MISLNTVSLLQQYELPRDEKSPNYGSILAVGQGNWRFRAVYTTDLVSIYDRLDGPAWRRRSKNLSLMLPLMQPPM